MQAPASSSKSPDHFIRQIFNKISNAEKLGGFKQSLFVFLSHFVFPKKGKSDNVLIQATELDIAKRRWQVVKGVLTGKE